MKLEDGVWCFLSSMVRGNSASVIVNMNYILQLKKLAI